MTGTDKQIRRKTALVPTFQSPPNVAYLWNLTASLGFPGGSDGKEYSLVMQEIRVRSLGGEDPLEEEMATHSSILAWEIPQTEEPGGLRLWDPEESDMTERLTHTHTHTHTHTKASQLEYLNHPGLPKTKGFPGMWAFQSYSEDSCGQAETVRSPRASKQKRNVICRVPVPELCSRVDLELGDSE